MIKTLIEASKAEILETVLKENDSLRMLVGSLNKRLDDLETTNRNLTTKCKLLEEKCTLNVNCVPQRQDDGVLSDEDMIQEARERHARRKFLIVSGLPESTDGNIEERRSKDATKIKEMASALGVKDLELKEVHRIGRISGAPGLRLLRFKCVTIDKKFSLLRSAKTLRSSSSYKGIYINNDLTRAQRLKNKELRMELKRRREAGEEVIIHHGCVVNTKEVKDKIFH